MATAKKPAAKVAKPKKETLVKREDPEPDPVPEPDPSPPAYQGHDRR